MSQHFQDFLNSLSDGLGVRVLRGILWLVLVAGLLSIYYATQYRGFTTADAMEHAQLARNMTRSGSFETQIIRPLDVWALRKASPEADVSGSVPDIRTPPAYAWVLSRFLPSPREIQTAVVDRKNAARTERFIVPILGGVLVLATAFVLFGLGVRVFNERVGRVVFVTYAVSASVLQAGFSGTALPLASFLVTAIFALCFTVAPAAGELHVRVIAWGGLVLAGLLSAAAFLCHYGLGLMLIPVLLLLGASCGAYRWGASAVVWVLALGLAAPWCARNLGLSGNPLGMAPFAALYDTLLYPDTSVDRTLAPIVHGSYLVPAIRMKFLSGLSFVMSDGLRLLGAGLVGACFWVSLFYRFDDERVNTLKWSTLLGLLLLGLVCAFDTRLAVYFNVLLPMMILVGVGFLAVLMERLLFVDEAVRGLLLWSLAGLAALPTLVQMFGVSPATRYPPYHPPTAEYVAGVMDADECMITDVPWATAWYGNQNSVLLPTHVADLADLEALPLKIGGLYLTQALSDKPYMSGFAAHYARDRSWLPLLNRQVPSDLPYVHGLLLPAGAQDQLFLTDRVRWETVPDLPVFEAPEDPAATPPQEGEE